MCISDIKLPIACIRCVLPKPTEPNIYNGFTKKPGFSETLVAVSQLLLLDSPTTKDSNVQFRFKLLTIVVELSFIKKELKHSEYIPDITNIKACKYNQKYLYSHKNNSQYLNNLLNI